MPQSIREIRRKINSITNTRQITKAMEMVAASRLKKAQQAAVKARPYADVIRQVIHNITAAETNDEGIVNIRHPMLETRPIKRVGYLIITSDRGLAGGFNSNLLRKFIQTIEERHQSPDEYGIMVVGAKGREYFHRRNMPITAEITGISNSPDYTDVRTIAKASVDRFLSGEFDELNLVYNVFMNAMVQVPTVKRLLPLEKMAHDGPVTEYVYEPSPTEVLDVLLPRYAQTLIYSAVLESKASEFGAKMTAMNNATKNATDLISSYTLLYNRARQAAITQEITEVVGGANAQS